MKVSLEYLYHFCCDYCGSWWSRADIEPVSGEQVHCPRCGKLNTVDAIQTFRNAARGSCLQKAPDPHVP
ncbi:hypothetical protein [Leptolyngbya sp. FACHB-261]|uniref:hypothetical protein n=1 Tax=Leptolyngbya sp. FACHB-261 TaxID=2692806 RepID=UPI001686697B|nr:hypothetical protein [Leptolyngbya sp. FACHB-261]MBD2104771.1 hypothetical protein [Leptolyngbya sp. FACHB-261]